MNEIAVRDITVVSGRVVGIRYVEDTEAPKGTEPEKIFEPIYVDVMTNQREKRRLYFPAVCNEEINWAGNKSDAQYIGHLKHLFSELIINSEMTFICSEFYDWGKTRLCIIDMDDAKSGFFDPEALTFKPDVFRKYIYAGSVEDAEAEFPPML